MTNLIEIDQQKCNQDGICAAVCPAGIITHAKGDFPGLVENAEEYCIRCGHCVAGCPAASLTHREMPLSDCPPVRPEMALTAEQCEHYFRSRRSIRTYRNKPVERETAARLIEMARYAPTGHNSQCVQWTVLGEKSELQMLSGIVIDWMRWMIENMPDIAASVHMERATARWEAGEDVILRGAPTLVLAHAEQELRPAPAACTIAAAYLELAAPTLGLGACWAGYFMAAAGNFPPMQEALPLPEGHLCFAAMMLGYPRFSYHRLPVRKAPQINFRLP